MKLIYVFLIAVLCLSFTSATRYEYYDESDDTQYPLTGIGEITSQTFTIGTVGADEAFAATNITLKLFRVSNPTILNVSLRGVTLATGKPNSTIFAHNNSFNVGAITEDTDGAWYNLKLTSVYDLQPSTQYAVVVSCPACDGTDYVQWKQDTADGYAGGQFWYSTNGEVSWTELNRDNMFEIHGGFAGATVNWINTTLKLPANNSATTNTYVNFTAEIIAHGNINLTNWTVYLWNSTNALINSTLRTLTGNLNNTNLYVGDLQPESYHWNAKACARNTTGYSLCNMSIYNYTFLIDTLVQNNNISNLTTAETAQETFIQNITTAGSEPTNVRLWYNGTYYTATTTNPSGDDYLFTATIQIPTGNGTKYWKYSYELDGIKRNTTANPQYVAKTIFQMCNSTMLVKYLNLTFKDEGTLAGVNASITYSSWVYWLGDGSINKTYTYTNSTGDHNIPLCAVPSARTLNVKPYVQYKSGAEYPQRIWNPSTLSLTNSTLNQTLYLLSSTSGQYVTFQVINSAEQSLQGVLVTATRTIDGVSTTVASGTTGADGSVTFWLDPNFVHSFTFVRSGYTTYSTSFTPTQTSYTITMGSAGATTQNNYYRGISISITPENTTITNRTSYDFTFALSSSYWEVTEFGFILKNITGDALGSVSEGTNGGVATLNINTANYTQILMDYYWVIEGNYTNGTRLWYVSSTGLSKFSIRSLIEDFKNYFNVGIFGLDNFGLAIITFLLIFVTTGIMSYKFGITNPASISVFVFTLILFFDVGLGLLDNLNPVGAIPHFITVLTGIIMVGVMFREFYR